MSKQLVRIQTSFEFLVVFKHGKLVQFLPNGFKQKYELNLLARDRQRWEKR